MAVGRISGPLLKANLERNGIDLDFRNRASDTPLLFFDVSTSKLGVKVDAPATELHISQDVVNTTAGPTYSVNSEENNPRGITFNNDGTKMFIVGAQGDDVNEYTLSVGFDLSSTVTFIDSYAVTECPNPTAVKFNADGTKMFVTGTSNSNVHEYALTTGFDVSTASFTQTLVTTVDNDNFGLDFSNDGTKMYITGNQTDSIYEYNLSSAFDISTATYYQDLYVNPYDNEPFGIEWSTDGYRLFIVGTRGNGVDEYKLTSAWNISTATHVGYYHIGGNPSGIHISPDGTKMFIVGNQTDQIKEFNLSVSYRVATPAGGGDATLRTEGLLVPGTNALANYTLNGNTIQVSTGNILFNAAEAIRATTIETDNIRITDNVISTFNSNTTFDITPNGTGIVESFGDMKVFGNLDTPQTVTMGGNITIGDDGSDTVDFNTEFTSDLTPDITDVSNLGNSVNKWQNLQTFRLNGAKVETPNVKIDTNAIYTLISNSNLDLRGNSAGNVNLEDLTFANTTISSVSDLNVASDTVIDTTAALQIPVGTNAQRPNTNSGIRFNSDTSQFEGYYNGNTIFGGVYSDDSLTNIVAHPTNNTIAMKINNVQVGEVNSTEFGIHALQVDDINFDNVNITTTTDTDLILSPAGTGASKAVKIDNIAVGETVGSQQIKSDTGIIEFAVTGYGANKLQGSYAVTIPYGDTSQRPVSPVLGDTRWNTQSNLLETYNGSGYISAAGSGGVVTRDEFDDILLQFTILLG